MAEDFYEPLPLVSYQPGLITKRFPEFQFSGTSAIITLLVTVSVIASATRLLSGADSKPDSVDGKDGRTVRLLPYWFPFLGHGCHL